MLKKTLFLLFTLLSFNFIYLPVSALTINSPLNNSDILNTLSTTLNISTSLGFNSTVTYSWNSGIKNTTLCTNCVSPNWTTITFPRQNYYNISVWATNSSGSIQSANNINIFVGNRSNLSSNEGIRSRCSDYSKAYESFVKIDTSSLINKNLFNSFNPRFNYYYESVSSGSGSNRYYLYISNQSWTSSINNIQTNSSLIQTSTNLTLIKSNTGPTTGVWDYFNISNSLLSQNINLNQNNFSIRFGAEDYNCYKVVYFDTINTSLSVNDSYLEIGMEEPGGSNFYNRADKLSNTTTANKPYLDVMYYNKNIALSIINILANNQNFTTDTVNFTYNISDDNDYITNISIFIDGIRNTTIYNQPITANTNNSLNFSIINIPDGVHSWFIRAYDSDGIIANSTNFTFRVDTTGPSVNIVYPTDYQSFNYKIGINVNFTRSDTTMSIDTCWWSNSSGVANYTLSAGANISVTESADGNYRVYIWCNDTLNNVGTSSINYIVSQDAPAITTNFPTNNQYLNFKNNIYFNFTATDSNNLDTCELWGNWTGTWSKNYTWVGPNSGAMNYTIISSIPDGKYKYNVWCNDTTNSAIFSSINRTFTIDTIYPVVNITSITTTAGSQTITFTHSASDNNLYSCKYSLFNSSGGVDGLYNNISFICSSTELATVSAYGNYNLTIYAIDYAGNENSSTDTFTTSALIPLSTTGGGGGTTVKQVSAVAIKQINATARNDLSRCIIYSRIRELCVNKTTECSINMTTLKNKIFENSLDITEEELEIWFKHYKLNDLESVQVLEDSVVLYKLFTGVLQITSQKLKINPSRLDPFFTFIIFSDEFKYPLESNREIKNFTIEGDMGLSLEKASTTKLFVVLKIPNRDFSFKTFTGRVNIIDTEGNSAFVDVNLRVVNLKNTTTLITLFISFGFIMVLVFNKKIKKLIKI